MAFGSSSKVFTAFVTDAVNRTNAFDLNGSDTFRVAIFGNSGTPDNTVSAANSAYNAGQWTTGNEASNGGWSAGGLALASVTSTFSSATYTFDAADSANGSAATTTAYGCLIYDDTLTTPVADQGICYLSFGGAQQVTAGTLTVVYNASGIMTIGT